MFSRALLILLALTPTMALAAEDHGLPSASEFWRVVSFQDYNTRVVVLGTMMLGIASGLVGTFLMLRKRALLADAISHATLPGIVIAFMLLASGGGTGKSFSGLLLGAAITGTLGMLTVMAIRSTSRLKDDAALGIVLSVFFGVGVALLNTASRMQQGSAAGLQSFIYGKPASMLMLDMILIGVVALVASVICWAFFKEFALVCFDHDFAATQGWPVLALDFAMMALVVVVTVIGLQAVGLILVVALLIIPAAAARFWSNNLREVLLVSGVIGGASGFFGSALSALIEDLPAGAIIVLVAAGFFTISLLFGRARGLLHLWMKQRALTNKVARQHLLRALYEIWESEDGAPHPEEATFSVQQVLSMRAWRPGQFRRIARRAERAGLLVMQGDKLRLTEAGAHEAERVLRNHRLWEMYLIAHADIAPSHVDRDADQIEHVLEPEMIQRLEEMLDHNGIPASPHG